MTSVAPFLVFLLGAALAAATKGRLRAAVMLAIPLVGHARTLPGMDEHKKLWPGLAASSLLLKLVNLAKDRRP